MRNYYIKSLIIFISLFSILYSFKVKANLPLTGFVIVVDAGHGAEDPGTIYGEIYEKNINLSLARLLEEKLSFYGATVILTRDGDYDLSSPGVSHRKKSDFDNRIKLINKSNANMYISLHLNYLSNSKYYGPQVFYNKDNKMIAKLFQRNLNIFSDTNREIKKIPYNTYMYEKLNIPGVLIECGFLSNDYERNKLIDLNYQDELSEVIAKSIIDYYYH